MWFQSHILASVLVFGPKPEAIIGSLAPDCLNILNWAKNIHQGRLNKKTFLLGEESINKVNNQGIIWNSHVFLHSFWAAGFTVLMSIFLYKINSPLWIFSLSYFLHIFMDYFTHYIKWPPLFPYKKWTINWGIIKYDPTNLKIMIFGDLLLLTLIIIRWAK